MAWKITNSESNGLEFITRTVCTGGANVLLGDEPDTTYTVRNDDTGVEKHVTASDTQGLGDRISRGDFDK